MPCLTMVYKVCFQPSPHSYCLGKQVLWRRGQTSTHSRPRSLGKNNTSQSGALTHSGTDPLWRCAWQELLQGLQRHLRRTQKSKFLPPKSLVLTLTLIPMVQHQKVIKILLEEVSPSALLFHPKHHGWSIQLAAQMSHRCCLSHQSMSFVGCSLT